MTPQDMNANKSNHLSTWSPAKQIVVNWHITEARNYGCDFCYAKSKPMAWPWMGLRGICEQRVPATFPICRDRVRRLMRRMGRHAMHRPPRTSLPGPGHKICPYLLKDLTIDRPNRVWSVNIIYLPMARGFGRLRCRGATQTIYILNDHTLTSEYTVSVTRYGRGSGLSGIDKPSTLLNRTQRSLVCRVHFLGLANHSWQCVHSPFGQC